MKLTDRYEILRQLGAGAMGEVHLARERSSQREVAIKVLKPSGTVVPQALERFDQEAKTLAKVSSPFVVRVLDYGRSGTAMFLVMEYAEGKNLEEVVRDGGPLPADRVGTILRDLALGLEAIHSQDVVHRDLKPGNILLDLQGSPRIVDFGLALPTSGPRVQTQDGLVLGTPGFLAPELLRGEMASDKADLYALGMVGYYLFTGTIPFPVASSAEIFKSQLQGIPPEKFKGLPPGLAALIRQLCHMVPAKRGSARRLSRYLQHFDPNAAPKGSHPLPATARTLSANRLADTQQGGPEHRQTGFRPVRLAAGGVAIALVAFTAFSMTRPGPPAAAPPPSVTPTLDFDSKREDAVEEIADALESFDFNDTVRSITEKVFRDGPPGNLERDRKNHWAPSVRLTFARDLRATAWGRALGQLPDLIDATWWNQLPREAKVRRQCLERRRWLHRRLLDLARLNAVDEALGGPGDLVPRITSLLAPVHRAQVRLQPSAPGEQIQSTRVLDPRCFYFSDMPQSTLLKMTVLAPSATAAGQVVGYCAGNRVIDRFMQDHGMPLSGAAIPQTGLAGIVLGVHELGPFESLEARYKDANGTVLASAFVHTVALEGLYRTSFASTTGWKAAQVELLVGGALLDGQAVEVELHFRDFLRDAYPDFAGFCGVLGVGWVEGVIGTGFAGNG